LKNIFLEMLSTIFLTASDLLNINLKPISNTPIIASKIITKNIKPIFLRIFVDVIR